MKKLDITILFLFAAQIYLYLTKSISTNFYLKDMFASTVPLAHIAFYLYVGSFIVLFSNFFTLFLAFKTKDEDEKRRYVLLVFFGTIFFLMLNFGFELLQLRLNQPVF